MNKLSLSKKGIATSKGLLYPPPPPNNRSVVHSHVLQNCDTVNLRNLYCKFKQ